MNITDSEYIRSRPISIMITNACNLSCGGCNQLCGQFSKEQIWFVSLEDFEKNVNVAKKQNKLIVIFGGEPTLHPKFKEILNICYKHQDATFRIYTNGRINVENHKNITWIIDPKTEDSKIYFLQTGLAPIDIIKDKNKEYYFQLAKEHCIIWKSKTCHPMIYNNKAYFCQNAGAFDKIRNEEHGWNIIDGEDPFLKTDEEIAEQASNFCYRCGWCLPREIRTKLPEQYTCDPYMVTESNLDIVKKNKSNCLQICKICKQFMNVDKMQNEICKKCSRKNLKLL